MVSVHTLSREIRRDIVLWCLSTARFCSFARLPFPYPAVLSRRSSIRLENRSHGPPGRGLARCDEASRAGGSVRDQHQIRLTRLSWSNVYTRVVIPLFFFCGENTPSLWKRESREERCYAYCSVASALPRALCQLNLSVRKVQKTLRVEEKRCPESGVFGLKSALAGAQGF